ncbi:MAG: 50S ribosomal protein L21 [Clostridia bacterium]|nr:50S ribosomal protein L21 [Clostridia bacterium]
MYAVIQTGGKQYKVQVGDVLYVEKLSAEADEVVKFDTVLAFADENGIQVGTPTLDIPVKAKVLKNGKAKKITVFTYKPKKNEKRKLGHRQPYTKIEITSINGVANA